MTIRRDEELPVDSDSGSSGDEGGSATSCEQIMIDINTNITPPTPTPFEVDNAASASPLLPAANDTLPYPEDEDMDVASPPPSPAHELKHVDTSMTSATSAEAEATEATTTKVAKIIDDAVLVASTDDANSAENDSDGDGNGNNINSKYKNVDHAISARCCQCRWMHFASTLLFVIGSVLYLVMAIFDYQWAQTLQTLPVWLRTADDDMAWMNYRIEELHNESLAVNAASGGVRKMKTRQFWLLQEEERENQAEYLASSLGMVAEAEGANTKNTQEHNSAVVSFVKEAAREEVPGKAHRRVTAKAAKRVAKTASSARAARTSSSSSGRNLRQATTPEDLYYNTCWAELPSDIQDAYGTLGYNEEYWDEGIATESSGSSWAGLSDQERQAAVFIGYTEEIWCEEEGGDVATVVQTGQPTLRPVTGSPTKQPSLKPVTQSPTTNQPTLKPVTEVPTSQITFKLVSVLPEDKELYELYWDDLTPQSQDLYAKLGYDDLLWNSGGKVPIDNKTWDEMSWGERLALSDIGVTQESWDAAAPGEHFLNQPSLFVAATPVPTDMPTKSSPVPVLVQNALQSDASASPSPIPALVQNVLQSSTSPTIIPAAFNDSTAAEPVVNAAGSTPEELYYNSCWAELPSDIQDSYAVLGFDENRWDNAIVPESDGMDWDELSSEMQEAALFIGYTKEAWDADVEPVAAEPDIVDSTIDILDEVQNPGVLDVLDEVKNPEVVDVLDVITTTKPTSSAAMSSLPTPASVQNILSPTSPISLQETSTPVESSQSDATPSFTPATSTVSTAAAPIVSTGPTPEELYYDEYWKDLPPKIQASYAVLGYNENTWNNAIVPASDGMYWDDLTPEIQKAALFIGYTKLAWNADFEVPSVNEPTATTDPALPPTNATYVGSITFTGTYTTNSTKDKTDEDKNLEVVEVGHYDTYGWSELPPEIQEAAATLGYDEQLWDTAGLSWSNDYWWDELPPEAQIAAALLGYSKQSWNEGGDSYEKYASDDDYVFQVGSSDVWVSQYQILYFFAALSFVFVGILDLIRERDTFHILMILAGFFGVVSAVYMEADIRLSNIFSLVSVHFFIFEAIALLGEHKRGSVSVDAARWMSLTVKLGELEFVVGALMDVILSYFYMFDHTSDWDITLQAFAIVGAVLWLHCSLIYVGVFFWYPEHDDTSVTFLRKDTAQVRGNEIMSSGVQRDENDLL